jgi:hypothetical protein
MCLHLQCEGVVMNKDEPPSTRLESSLFFVGKNSRGNWVVQDGRGIRGGLFLDRGGALKFAKSESAGGPPAVIMMDEPFELDMRTVRGTSEATRRVSVSRGH